MESDYTTLRGGGREEAKVNGRYARACVTAIAIQVAVYLQRGQACHEAVRCCCGRDVGHDQPVHRGSEEQEH